MHDVWLTFFKSRLFFDSCICTCHSTGYCSCTNTLWSVLWLHMHKITSTLGGLVSSYLANVFWLLIYLISFNRSVIEIHQKFLSVLSPLMSEGFQHLLRLHYWGSSLGPLIARSDRTLVTEIINLKTLFVANALQELFTSHDSWCHIIGVLH